MIAGAFRYALYLIPEPQTLLWRMGSALLGYDAATGETLRQPVPDGLDAEALARMTAEARRYGFHMTLKAPFRLAQGHEPQDLVEAVHEIRRDHPLFSLGALQVRSRPVVGEETGFLCLEPDGIPEALAALECDVVTGLDRFRAPLTREEIARRAPDRLTPRQQALLDAFGYPFVLDEFRPHFSLTGRIATCDRDLDGFRSILAPALRDAVDHRYRLALFVQHQPDGAFRLAD